MTQMGKSPVRVSDLARFGATGSAPAPVKRAQSGRWRRPRTGASSGGTTSGSASCTTPRPSGRASSSARSPGLENEPLYTPERVELDYDRDLGYPGVYPFTRGVYPSMYRGRLWTMRQFAGFGTAEETNERFRYLLDHGQTGLSTAFDMPTLMGYDSDHARSLGEVGREGVAIDSLADMETLFAGHPARRGLDLDDDQRPAAMLLAFYVCVAEQQGVAARRAPRDDPDGHPQGVHRAEGVDLPARAVDAARRRTWSSSARASCRAGTRSRSPATTSARPARTPSRSSPSRSPTASPTSTRRSSAGSTSTSSRRGCRFFFNAHLDFFEEIAKYRAARRIWARELRERYGAKNPRSWLMRFHTQTAGVSLTAQQPEVNIVRTALEALAAVLGGTQSLHTNSFDEALALPTEDAVRIALRTQQVIAHETGVVNTIDPLGGSYYVEDLTNRLEAEAYDYFDADREARRRGRRRSRRTSSSARSPRRRSATRPRSRRSSGSSSASTATSSRTRREIEILRIDPALEQKQIERVQGAARAPRLGRGRGARWPR